MPMYIYTNELHRMLTQYII